MFSATVCRRQLHSCTRCTVALVCFLASLHMPDIARLQRGQCCIAINHSTQEVRSFLWVYTKTVAQSIQSAVLLWIRIRPPQHSVL